MAHAAVVGGARHQRGPSRRGVRERRVPLAPPAHRPGDRGRLRDRAGRRSLVAGARGLAAARRGRRLPSRAVAGRARRPPRSARRREPRRPPLRDRPPPRRPLRPLRPAPAGHGPRVGDGRRRRHPAGRDVAGRAVAAPARADRPPRPGRATRARVRAPARRPVPHGPPEATLALQPDPPAAGPPRRPARARRPPRRPPVPPAPVARAVGARRAGDGRHRRPSSTATTDPTAAFATNRLLASWGHDARELQLVVTGHDDPIEDEHHAAPHDPGTLLERIQQDVRADHPPARAPLAAHDRSIEIHACHGRARQVEVLRDAILHLLADDPTLEPRDVIVMCPDIETFAPLIHATFGVGDLAGGGDGEDDDPDTLPDDVRPPDLRVRLADRSLRQTNPVLGAVAELLELAGQRITASQLLDLADREPGAPPPAPRRRRPRPPGGLGRRERHPLGPRRARIVRRSGSTRSRRAPGAPASTACSSASTMTEDGRRLCHGVLPLDDVDSGDIDLAGRFAELARPAPARARRARAAPSRSTPGRDALGRAPPTRSRPPRRATPGSAPSSQRLLDDVVAEAGGRRDADSRSPRSARCSPSASRGRPTRANFRTGHLTVCTLMPMRSVPHRVVCLLGLDDGAFPRKAPRDGDDLMLRPSRTSATATRAPRTASSCSTRCWPPTERLVITYTGNDERTNAPRPPAVPVGELLDVVDRTARRRTAPRRARTSSSATRCSRSTRATSRPAASRPTARGASTRVDARRRPGARRRRAARPRRSCLEPLPPAPDRVVELDDARALRRAPRAGVPAPAPRDQPRRRRRRDRRRAAGRARRASSEWGVGERLLEARLDGARPRRRGARPRRARGTLPPGRLGEPVLARVLPGRRRRSPRRPSAACRPAPSPAPSTST